MRTVRHVLRGKLLERAPAQAQVLDRPGQVALGRRQGQDLADDLELVPGLTVDVHRSGLDLADQLAVGPRAQAVELRLRHGGGNYQGVRPYWPARADPDLPRLPPPRHR